VERKRGGDHAVLPGKLSTSQAAGRADLADEGNNTVALRRAAVYDLRVDLVSVDEVSLVFTIL